MAETAEPKPSETPTPPAANPEGEQASEKNDPETDKAVEDILRHEGDDALKAQDDASHPVVMKQGIGERFKNGWINWWSNPRTKWGTIVAMVVIIGALFAVPFTRYEIIGLVVREKVTVEAIDTKTGTPVSDATVMFGGVKAETDADGKAILDVHAGRQRLDVTKKYYTGSDQTVLVTLSKSKNIYKVKLTAQGQPVQVKVLDDISNNPVSGATVSAGGASAKTNSEGIATIVVLGAATESATISQGSYNQSQVTITASGNLATNTFHLTPAGKVYFLSNMTGTIDVDSVNLDGSDTQTVLAGTGSEDPSNTVLMASPDGKYLALLARRSGSAPTLYLIDTTNNNQLSTIDSTNGTYTMVGWSGDDFIYFVSNASVSDWQANQEKLESFNASSGQLLLLDQTQGSGTSEADYLKQSFGQVFIFGNQLVYTKSWSAGNEDELMTQVEPPELDTIGVDGSGHKVLQSFTYPAGQPYLEINAKEFAPEQLYVGVFNAGSQNFYDYANGSVTADSSLSLDTFDQTFPNYLLSPSGDQTFWSVPEGGLNTLYIGDQNARNQKQLATASAYAPYGWLTDNYLLLSRGDSELYVMSASGGTPQKLTDYYATDGSSQ